MCLVAHLAATVNGQTVAGPGHALDVPESNSLSSGQPLQLNSIRAPDKRQEGARGTDEKVVWAAGNRCTMWLFSLDSRPHVL